MDNETRAKGTPGRLSLWFQRKMNTRTVAKIRRKGYGRMMGMDVLILHTAGRKTGQDYQTPVAWYPDGDGARLVVASGGGSDDPNWYRNLTAHPDRARSSYPVSSRGRSRRAPSTARTATRRGRSSSRPTRGSRSTRPKTSVNTRSSGSPRPDDTGDPAVPDSIA